MAGISDRSGAVSASGVTVLVTVAACLGFAHGGGALAADVFPPDRSPTYNDWGLPGLLQMPNGRTFNEGEFGIAVSNAYPYFRGTVGLTPLPWFMATFRYTSVSNVLYGPVSFSGHETYKDKSADVKVRLIQEGAVTPSVSFQLQDITGSGYFSSEYLVASRRYYDLDLTFGMAWGYEGSRGNIPNPFGLIANSFNTRAAAQGTGNFNPGSFFHGPAAVFGGVEYITPIDGFRLKVEYDGNSYQNEPFTGAYMVRTPFNVGADYAALPWLGLSAAFERGTTAMLRATLHSNLNTDLGVLQNDSPPRPVVPRPHTDESTNTAGPPPARLDTAPQNADRREMASLVNQFGLTVISAKDSGLAQFLVDANRPLPSSHDLARIAALTAKGTVTTVGGKPPQAVSFVAARDGYEIARAEIEPPYLTQLAEADRTDHVPDNPLIQWKIRPNGESPMRRPELVPKRADTPPIASGPHAPPVVSEDDRNRIAREIFAELDAQLIFGNSLSIDGYKAELSIAQGKYRNFAKAIGRAARAAARHLPPHVESITITVIDNNLPLMSVTMQRSDLEKLDSYQSSPAELWQHVSFDAPDDLEGPDTTVNPGTYPSYRWGLAPHFREDIGGPNNFLFYQLYAEADAALILAPGLLIQGGLGQDVHNNFGGLIYPSNSTLPHVRSDIASYLKGGSTWIENLYMNYSGRIAPDLYGQVSGGVMELMYSGAAGELLYAPHDSLWSVAGDVERVQQRNYHGTFGLLPYHVLTGGMTVYREFPVTGITATVHVGKYLAKDIGATMLLEKEFHNGVRLGAFATKTNVSAAQFGEGSFDKGITISVPLDLFTGEPTRTHGYDVYRPLSRDGGQTVAAPSLYEATRTAKDYFVDQQWNQIGK